MAFNLLLLLIQNTDVVTLPGAKELVEVNPYGVAVYGTLVTLLVSAVVYMAKQLRDSQKREIETSAKFIEIMREVASNKSASDADKIGVKMSEYHNDVKSTLTQNKADLINTINNGFNNIK